MKVLSAMKKIERLAVAAALVTATRVTPAFAADGLIAVKSPHSAKETMTRLEDTVKARCLNVFTRVEHAAGAAKTGKTLRTTEVIIFGNPQGGTPLMEYAQSMGIDLPLKALVWEDAAAQVWVGYNDPAYLAKRHAAGDCAAVKTVGKALAGVMSAGGGQVSNAGADGAASGCFRSGEKRSKSGKWFLQL